MSEVLVRCLACKKQKPCTVSPVPPLWHCDACAAKLGPWPKADAPKAGLCIAEGGHYDLRVYPTQWGLHCLKHLTVARRTAIFPANWKADR